MQLQPSIAREYGADARIPEQNIDAGTRYLRFFDREVSPEHQLAEEVIAAYNARFAAVDRYHGVPPFRETQCYVNRVLALMQQYQS